MDSTTSGFCPPGAYHSPFAPPSAPAADTPPRVPSPPPHTTGETRTCRICLDQVPPPYTPDPDLGRLISPCVCRGSSRFVHQGCLQEWRISAADGNNFYQCPTCKYRYQFRRLRIAAVVGSTGLRFGITAGIMLVAVYLLGFVSEPIITTYLDPPSLLTRPVAPAPPILVAGKDATWAEHMLRGLASLGLLGFLKVAFLLGPSSWWNIRNSSGIGAGMGRSGRERAAQISWVVVAIGVVNFFVFTWKQVGGWVKTGMERAAEEILEVGGEGSEGE